MSDNSRTWITHTGFLKASSGESVYDAALARIHACFDRADRLRVAFSGGKDSTVILQLALQVARERDRLPLSVWLFDDELIDPDTIAYCQEVATWPDLDFRWYCVPIRHSLGARERSHWFAWDPDERAVWARDLPLGAITEVPGWVKHDNGNLAGLAYHLWRLERDRFRVGLEMVGVRAAEAFNRRRGIMNAGTWLHDRGVALYAKPIYDWETPDVWRAIIQCHWPYSAYYDRLRQLGVTTLRQQRVAPMGNVSAVRETQHYAALYPDFWDRALRRLPELRAQARYGAGPLYSGLRGKPAGMTWQEYTLQLVGRLNEEDRAYWLQVIKQSLVRYRTRSTLPLPETPNETAEISWKRLAHAVAKNDRAGSSSRDRW